MHQLILLAQAQQQGQGMTGTFILVGLMFLVFWFLVWRPQAKEQERHETFTKSLKRGDKVATASGLLGTIAEIDGNVVTLEIARNTKIRVLRRTIQSSEEEAISGDDAAKAAGSKENDDSSEKKEESGDKDKKSKKEKKQSEEW